jgi:hypothetical protein
MLTVFFIGCCYEKNFLTVNIKQHSNLLLFKHLRFTYLYCIYCISIVQCIFLVHFTIIQSLSIYIVHSLPAVCHMLLLDMHIHIVHMYIITHRHTVHMYISTPSGCSAVVLKILVVELSCGQLILSHG